MNPLPPVPCPLSPAPRPPSSVFRPPSPAPRPPSSVFPPPSPVPHPLSPHHSTIPSFHSSALRAGFTLVEILVVIAIISLLAGVVLLNIAPQIGMGSQAAAKAQIQVLASALNTYRMAHGQYPSQTQGLDALVRKPDRDPIPANYPAGGYLNSRTLPLDPWKRPYLYLTPGRQDEPFEILCYGADGEPGGEGADADISSSDAE